MVDRDGPVLVEGPVEVVAEDGTVATADRFVVAICTCRRSATYPWCDTSHRRRAPRTGGTADQERDREERREDRREEHRGKHREEGAR